MAMNKIIHAMLMLVGCRIEHAGRRRNRRSGTARQPALAALAAMVGVAGDYMLHKRLVAVVAAAAFATALPTSPAYATMAWEDGRAYTAMLEEHAAKAAKAAKVAAVAAAAAAADLARAQTRVAAAGGTAVATTAATLAELAAAQAAIAKATAIAAATKTAAVATAGAVAAAATGTYIGQGLRGVWDWCWDPVCDLTALDATAPIYSPPSLSGVEALLPELTSLGSSGELSFSRDDFDEAGVSTNFIVEGAALFIGAAKGAAAATAGDDAGVARAILELQPALASYRNAIETFATQLPAQGVDPDSLGLAAARLEFDNAVAGARAACDGAGGDDCAALDDLLANAQTAFADAEAAYATVTPLMLIRGPDPLFPALSLNDFDEFLLRTALLGGAALPEAEIQISQALLDAAGVFFPSTTIGEVIAQYDAKGVFEGNERQLFDPMTGLLTIDQMLLGSVTILSDSGWWLNIDLSQSPLATPVPEPPTALLMVVALTLWLGLRRRAWITCRVFRGFSQSFAKRGCSEQTD